MKIKFFMFLCAFALTAAAYATPTVVIPNPTDEVQTECVSFVLEVEAGLLAADSVDLENTLNLLVDALDDEITCEVTVKVKLGTSGTGVEGSFTVKGDCDEIMNIAAQKLKELKKMIF